MNSDSVKIFFCFPEISKKVTDKEEFANLVLKEMESNEAIKYSGYLDKDDFVKDLKSHLGENVSLYNPLSPDNRSTINAAIIDELDKCHQVLPHPDLPIFVSVYPWFPDSKESLIFGGSTAFAAYYTMHVFVDINKFSKEFLFHTIAHEWNHLVFYRHHPEKEYTLLSHMVMEGFAEVFREEVAGGDSADWSIALTEEECKNQLNLLNNRLDETGMDLYKEVFWGSTNLKRWTGYSIGYQLVKKFRSLNQNISWEELVKTDPKEILNVYK